MLHPTQSPGARYASRYALCAVAIFVVLFSFFSCQNALRGDAFYESLSRYVYAYSGGTVARNAPVRLRFVHPAIQPEQIGQRVPTQVFSVSPSIEGEAVWEDDRTIVLRPAKPLPHGQAYAANVALSRIWDEVPSGVRNFEFDFRVRDLAYETHADGLHAEDPNNLRQQQVRGRVVTTDEVDHASVEKMLTARQANRDLSVSWNHAEGGLTHSYVVSGVERGNERSAVQLTWDGQALGLSGQVTKTVAVPSLDDFEVLAVRAEQLENQCVVVNFSDPISPSQVLDGLVQIDGYAGDYRYVTDGNSLRVYPTKRVTGQRHLRVNQAVRNSAGAQMKSAATWPLGFEELKPQVRLVGRGAIIPGDEKGSVIFPFEAVGVNAVDVEIFKIYNSNILQYLQVNEIEGEQELQRVGKITLQKKVSLTDLDPSASTKAWQRYALDLKDLIRQDPGAIYQVRLSFRKSYAVNLNCNTAVATTPANSEEEGEEYDEESGPAASGDLVAPWNGEEPVLPKYDQYGNMVPIADGYRGVYWADDEWQWRDGYEYSHRTNPCYREYYNRDVFDRRNVFVSDLGLTAKRGTDGSVFAAVTDLHTAQPMSGVQLEFFNFQLQSIGKATTGRDGIATTTSLRDVPFVMVATQGSHRGYLRMAEGHTLSLSRFDVAGVEAQRGLKGYLYGERGVWRPGDSIFLNFVLEDKTGKLPIGHPVSFELFDPKGTQRYRDVVSKGVNGVYALHCATHPEAPTGNWTARVDVGGAKFSKTLKIETVKPNRLKLDLDFGKKYLTSTDNGANGKLNVRWLVGSTAKGLKTKVEMQVRTATTEFPNFKGFKFEDPARGFYSDPQVLFEGTIDDQGNALVPFKINITDAAPGKLIANFKVRAFEQGGDFSTDNFAMDYFPFDRMVGIRVPDQVEMGQANDVQVVCVDNNGKPLANRTLEVGMYRCDWRWWWDSDRDLDVGQFNSATHVNALDRGTVRTDANGRAIWKAKPTQWGRYLVRVTDSENGDNGHAAGSFFWVGYPDRLDDLHSRNAAAMLPLTADKEKYNVGETVTIKVPSSDIGRVLVTLENGQRVVEHLWFDTKAGDNLLTFKTSESMAPAVYAHVSLIQPHAQTKNDLPIRMYGVVPINVENAASRLQPIIDMADAIRPDENFEVRVREAKGMACAYTLAIVDEGLLDLTRFKTPNPWEEFFAREALGVKTWDLYDYVLGAYGVQLERILGIGGDGINQKARNAAQVNRFKPAVIHVGPFYLEKGKTATHRLQVKNYVGSVRVMAVMSDPKPDSKGAYGMAEKTVPVRKPVMVLPTLPRVLGPGESLRLPVEVFAMEKQVKSATVRVREVSGLVNVGGSPTQTLNFAEPGQQMAYFDLKVGEKTGPAKFLIEAQGGGETATSEIEIMVRNPMPVATSAWQGVALPGQAWTSAFDPSQYADIESATLEVSALPPINLNRHLDYLIGYPHGCLEQTTSRVFPQLYVDAITTLTQKQKDDITRYVSVAISKIQNQQDYSGGFTYWPGVQADEWITSYAGHFLLEAKTKGYAVPEAMLEKWVTFQSNVARGWQKINDDPNNRWRAHDGQIQQAYRLYTLALASKPALGDMNRFREISDLYPEAAYLLASAYVSAGKPEVARELTAKKWREAYAYDWCGYTYGSDLRDRSLMLETYVATGDMARAEALVKYLSDEIGGEQRWYWSTQSLATALRALSRYATKSGVGGPAYTYALGSTSAKNGDASKVISSVRLGENAYRANQITVNNTGSRKLYTRVVVRGQQKPGSDMAGQAENIRLDVRYLDMNGKPIDHTKIKQGTDFVAEVTVKRQSKLTFLFNEIALTQIFPSGWEITNTRMGNFGQAASAAVPEYQDFRDDRVLTYFDLNPGDGNAITFKVQLTAAYAGRYFQPALGCEAMYDTRIRASVPGWWVEVI
jgi:alpha-2-macroglobulin